MIHKLGNQLDSEQLNFLQNSSGNNENYWLKGYAGSGKSVLLIHSLLKEKELRPHSNIIIVLYTHALIDMIKSGIPDQYQNIDVVTYHKFNKMEGSWDLILVDEVQDLPEYIVRNIYSKGKRVIVAGDVNQSIYDNVSDSEQIRNVLGGQVFTLGIIHRISRRIRQVAQLFCADRAGFNAAALGRLVELPPRLVQAKDYDEECRWLILCSKEYAATGYAPVILIPNHKAIIHFVQTMLEIENKPLLPEPCVNSQVNNHLNKNGLKFQYLGNGEGSFKRASSDSLVTIMTYHSAKGLDYKAVFIPFLTPDLAIWKDPESRRKTLFFVAVTRSREQLFLSYNSKNKHPYLDEIPENEFYKLDASNEISRMSDPFLDNQIDNEPIVVF